jgi:phage terminase large subunit GpA-like protein
MLSPARDLFLTSMATAMRPRKRLTVSEWADAHRVLSAKGSSEAGPWKTSRTPFLEEIMDCLSERSNIQRVVLMFSAQIGKTEVGLNWLGYIIEHAPAPTLVVVPTIQVRKRWAKQRLEPMLVETPTLAEIFDARRKRDKTNSDEIKDFPGGMLVLGGANSPASLASMPIRYVLCDEVDRFPWDVGGEGDPLGLIDERQKTFPRRKTLLVSTPTIKHASRIDAEYTDSDQRVYQVPCPDCGHHQPLKWKQLGWNSALTEAWYVCQECGSAISENHKTKMLAEGSWVAKNPGHLTRGYHLNGLYSPVGLGFKWLELAQEWARVHEDPAQLKRFINTTLGEVWEDQSSSVKPGQLAARAGQWESRTVPDGALILTAGIDTQDDRLAIQIIGHGRKERTYIIDYHEIPGHPGRPELWMKLTKILTTPLTNRHGHEMHIQAAAIDTGGHYTHEVYQYVRSRPARRVIAIKGKNTPGGPVLAGRPSYQDINWRGKVIKKGVALYLVGSDTGKHLIYGRLKADEDQPEVERLIQFNQSLEEDYYKMLTAEIFDPEKNRWVLRKGRRNESLDTWIYGVAAAHHPEVRVQAMRERDWDVLEARLGAGEAKEISQQQARPKKRRVRTLRTAGK